MILYSQICVRVKQFWPQKVSTQTLKNTEHSLVLYDSYYKALNFIKMNTWYYIVVQHFWLVETLAELADRPTACDEVARGGVYLLGPSVWQNKCAEQEYLWKQRQDTKPDMTVLQHKWLLPGHLKIPSAKTHALHNTNKTWQPYYRIFK
jgi:hypothetical protein